MLKMVRLGLTGSLIVALIAGCGGGGGAGETDSTAAPYTGRFSDAPVVGLIYKTKNRTGVTDGNGYFSYDVPGEEVLFMAGSLDIGRARAASEVTIFNLDMNTDEKAMGKYGRIAQILQALDTGVSADKIVLPVDVAKKFDGSYTPNFMVSQLEFDAGLNKKISEWGVGKFVSYDDALAKAQDFAKKLETACGLPDPLDTKGVKIVGLSCADKSRLNFFRSRIAPFMDSSVQLALNQSQLIEEAWSESAAQDAIDVNPIISALQAGDAIADGFDAQAKEQSMSVLASLAITFAKGSQIIGNLVVTFDSDTGSNKKEALRASKQQDLTQKILETMGSTTSCLSYFKYKKDADVNDCIKTISGVAGAAEKAYGAGVLKVNSASDTAAIKSALKVIADGVSSVSAAAKFLDSVPNGGDKMRKSAVGLAGAVLKTARDAVTLSYANNGEKPPKTGAMALMLGTIDNAAAPILAVGKNCIGVKDNPEPVQYWKCISSQAQETGKVAVKLAFASVGTVESIRKVGAMNESLVAKEVIHQFLMKGAGNEGALYRKYGVSYNDDSGWNWVSPINLLIARIGNSEFSNQLSGVADYSDWIGVAWNAVVRDKNSYSIDEVRKLVIMYMDRINNEASLDFDSGAIDMSATKNSAGMTFVSLTVDPARYGISSGKIVCSSEGSSNFSAATPWMGQVSGRSNFSFVPYYSDGGNKGVICLLYSASGVFKGAQALAMAEPGNLICVSPKVLSSDGKNCVAPAIVQSIAPTSASMNVLTTFTITGQNLPLTPTMTLGGIPCQTQSSPAPTAGGFTAVCTPGGAAGSQVVKISDSAGAVIDQSRSVTVAANALPTPVFSVRFDQESLASLGGVTSTGGVSYISGKDGRPAAKFSGINAPGHIKISNRESLKFVDGATFDMWVYMDSMTGMDGWGSTVRNGAYAMALVAKSHDRSGGVMLANSLTNPDGSLWHAGIGNWDSCKHLSSTPVPLGTWARVTYVFSSTSGTYAYLNKGLVWNCPGDRPNFGVMNTQDMYIGKYSDSWYPFSGAIQDLNVYSKALSSAQVSALQ